MKTTYNIFKQQTCNGNATPSYWDFEKILYCYSLSYGKSF